MRRADDARTDDETHPEAEWNLSTRRADPDKDQEPRIKIRIRERIKVTRIKRAHAPRRVPKCLGDGPNQLMNDQEPI